jgi:hypothetical protein
MALPFGATSAALAEVAEAHSFKDLLVSKLLRPTCVGRVQGACQPRPHA